jgi:hypothetical protein
VDALPYNAREVSMNDERCVCGHVEIDHENGRFECRACSDDTVPCPMFVLDRGAIGRRLSPPK